MDKPALDAEGFDGPQTCVPDPLRQILYEIIHGIGAVIYNVHQGQGCNVAGLKERLALGINDSVIGLHIGVDKLLHDVHVVILGIDEEAQILVRLQLVGIVGTHTVVRLDNDRVADGVGKFRRVVIALHQVVPGCGNTGFGIVFLHCRLEFDLCHVGGLGTGGDVELGTKLSVPHEPVFIPANRSCHT